MGNALLLTIERLPEQRATAVGCRLHAVRVVISHDDTGYAERLAAFFEEHCDCGRAEEQVHLDLAPAHRAPRPATETGDAHRAVGA